MDHERWYAICKSSINHEISCICKYCRVKSCDITHEIIESISSHSSSCIKINTMKSFHYICVIWNFKIWNNWITVFLDFYIFRIIFSDRYCIINDLRNDHHLLKYFIIYFFLSSFKFFKSFSTLSYFFFHCHCFFFFTLSHECTDFFRNLIFLCSKIISFLLNCSSLIIQFHYFIY